MKPLHILVTYRKRKLPRENQFCEVNSELNTPKHTSQTRFASNVFGLAFVQQTHTTSTFPNAVSAIAAALIDSLADG
jgi:hypothetical protein